MIIWDLISPETRGALVNYNLKHHRKKLQDPRPPVEPIVTMSPEVEEDHIAETNKFMAQPPSRSRGGTSD